MTHKYKVGDIVFNIYNESILIERVVRNNQGVSYEGVVPETGAFRSYDEDNELYGDIDEYKKHLLNELESTIKFRKQEAEFIINYINKTEE